MLRFLFIISILIASAPCFAQLTVHYWFDQQTERQVLTGNTISTEGLTTGIHTAHFQITDTDGNVVPVESKIFLVLNHDTTLSSEYKGVEYWFDQQTERQAMTGNTISTEGLTTGIHTAHFQITDTDGNVVPVESKNFLVLIHDTDLSSAYKGVEYWFDQEQVRTTLSNNAIDCDMLPTGMHAVHFQLIDMQNALTPTRSQLFLKLNEEVVKLYYWFDNDEERTIIDTDVTEISVEHLCNGRHTLNMILADKDGHALSSDLQTANFVIVCPDNEHIDDDSNGECDICGSECVVTGINGVETDNDNHSTPDAIYNTSGIRVPRGSKGILIINGKKVYIK